MLNIQERIEENPSDEQLRECFHNITKCVEENICFLIYQWRTTKNKYSLQLGMCKNECHKNNGEHTKWTTFTVNSSLVLIEWA